MNQDKDVLVWRRVAKLMSSPDLLSQQLTRWLNKKRNEQQNRGTATEDMKNSTAKLKEKVDRYHKAYGAGLLSVEQLKDYVMPIRESIAAMEAQMAQAQIQESRISEATLPGPE